MLRCSVQIERIVTLLISERDRLSRAIDALQAPAKRRGRPLKVAVTAVSPPAAPVRRKRRLSAAARKAMAEAARRRWASVKAAKSAAAAKKSPGPKAA